MTDVDVVEVLIDAERAGPARRGHEGRRLFPPGHRLAIARANRPSFHRAGRRDTVSPPK